MQERRNGRICGEINLAQNMPKAWGHVGVDLFDQKFIPFRREVSYIKLTILQKQKRDGYHMVFFTLAPPGITHL